MKTGNVTHDSLFLAQSKPLRENRTSGKKEPGKAIEEKVDLSTKSTVPKLSYITSDEEALGMVNGLDFQQVRNVQWVSADGTAQLMTLMLA